MAHRIIAKRLLLSGAGAIAGCVSGLFGVASNSSDPEEEKFFSPGRMASRDLPLSGTHIQTDKCKISIMIL